MSLLLCIKVYLKRFIKTHGKDGEQAFTPSPLYWSAGWIPWEGKSMEEFPCGGSRMIGHSDGRVGSGPG